MRPGDSTPTLAVENGSLVWSLDVAFARMEALDMIECYAPLTRANG